MAYDNPELPRSHRREAYMERFARGDSYGLLLVVLLVLYVMMASLSYGEIWYRFFISLVLAGAMLLTLHTSHVRSRAFRVIVTLVALVEFANFVQALVHRNGNDGSTFLMFALILAAPIVILNRIIRHDTVTLETILGAICVFVLIGIAFAGIYAAVNDVEPTGFFAQRVMPQSVDFLYFSFVTITTVGYGDLTAGTSTGKVLVTFEALIGQIFLVTLVARLVGMYGLSQRRDRAGPDDGSELEK
jgi:hypothetical protein